MRHQIRRVPHGKSLRVILANQATVTWSADRWATVNKTETIRSEALNLWHADFATERLRERAVLEFTFFWNKPLRWEGRNYSITVE